MSSNTLEPYVRFNRKPRNKFRGSLRPYQAPPNKIKPLPPNYAYANLRYTQPIQPVLQNSNGYILPFIAPKSTVEFSNNSYLSLMPYKVPNTTTPFTNGSTNSGASKGGKSRRNKKRSSCTKKRSHRKNKSRRRH